MAAGTASEVGLMKQTKETQPMNTQLKHQVNQQHKQSKTFTRRATKLRLLAVIGTSLMISITAFATEPSYDNSTSYSHEHASKHNIEVSIAAGDLNLNSGGQRFKEDSAKHRQLSYHYQLSNGVYLGLGLIDGESGDLSPIDDLFGGNELEYQAELLKAGFSYQSSERHALYAELLLLNHDTSLNIGSQTFEQNNEFGWGLASGWQYSWSQNLNLKLGLQQLNLDSDLDIKTITASVGLRF